MTRPRLTQAEIHLSHACNFTCVSCSHFSQDGHGGRLTLREFEEQVAPWGKRIQPHFVLLLGGEPLLNPEVCELIVAARRVWPEDDVRIFLVTNGFLLRKFPQLPAVLREQRIRLDISRHHDSPEYLAKLDEAINLARSWGIEPVIRDSFKDWTYIYHGTGADVRPYEDGDPQASWEACVSHWCHQIFRGQLWKCPPVAYLRLQREKFAIDEQAWEPFLSYQPLSPDCTEEELLEFLRRRCEAVCGQCPAKAENFLKPLPVRPKQLELADG